MQMWDFRIDSIMYQYNTLTLLLTAGNLSIEYVL